MTDSPTANSKISTDGGSLNLHEIETFPQTDGSFTTNDSKEKGELVVAGKTYATFRKYFHLPSVWLKDKAFMDLCQHRYETKDHKEAFVFIEQRLRKLGYSEDNQRMLHDYMHYLLMDMLTAANVPFLSEDDMKDPTLFKLLDGKTPDLIIKSAGPDTVRPKPLIMDVFVGKGDKTIAEKKSKYSTMKVVFDFAALTVGNYNVELQRVLDQADVDYFHRQFVLFQAEYSYWHACLKFKKILFNDVQNSKILTLREPSPQFALITENFKRGLKLKAEQLTNTEEL